MRIALCTDFYLPQLSGVADSVATLAATLRHHGHHVRIYSPRVEGGAAEPGIVRLPSWELPGAGGGLAFVYPIGTLRDLRRFAPDVIHTHSFSTVGLAALRAARRLGVPLVGTDHTLPAHYLHYARLDFAAARAAVCRLAAWYYERCAVVTAPSRAMLEELQASGLDRPCEVVSNPIPTDLFRPLGQRADLKRALGIGPRAVLLFGRIAAEKNWALAAEVFRLLAARSDTELVVIGDGPDRSRLAAELDGHGLAARTHFLGLLRGESLVEAINACDAYLITSLSETQSMAMLQAAASGLPVVAAAAGGLPEYVVSGTTGFLADPDDPQAFAVRLGLLLDNPDLAERLGAAGRQFATQFSPETVTRRFEAVYSEALASHRESARTDLSVA